IEAARRSRNLGVKALAANAISQSLHRRAEAIDGRGFAQDDEDVDGRLGRKAGNRRAADVMNGDERVAEHSGELSRLVGERRIPGRTVLDDVDGPRHWIACVLEHDPTPVDALPRV